ncbi:hypothetical protein [Weissella diestrammenae]|nr:hypothetical protein [Weissella diestrammenae]MCM0583144.1 hypothetical protein [Weissella diestrammenae]
MEIDNFFLNSRDIEKVQLIEFLLKINESIIEFDTIATEMFLSDYLIKQAVKDINLDALSINLPVLLEVKKRTIIKKPFLSRFINLQLRKLYFEHSENAIFSSHQSLLKKKLRL